MFFVRDCGCPQLKVGREARGVKGQVWRWEGGWERPGRAGDVLVSQLFLTQLKGPDAFPSLVALRLWSLDWQHQPRLEIVRKAVSPAPPPPETH